MKRLSTQFIFIVKIFCLISSQAQFLNGCFSEYFNQTNNSANFKEINVMINETLQLECSLESQIDHVIWKRKMNDDIQILTINEYNFISMSWCYYFIINNIIFKKLDDLRIRPIKSLISKVENKTFNSSIILYRWSLEIRKIQIKDKGCYFCVMNSIDKYGQIFKINVLRNKPILL